MADTIDYSLLEPCIEIIESLRKETLERVVSHHNTKGELIDDIHKVHAYDSIIKRIRHKVKQNGRSNSSK